MCCTKLECCLVVSIHLAIVDKVLPLTITARSLVHKTSDPSYAFLLWEADQMVTWLDRKWTVWILLICHLSGCLTGNTFHIYNYSNLLNSIKCLISICLSIELANRTILGFLTYIVRADSNPIKLILVVVGVWFIRHGNIHIRSKVCSRQWALFAKCKPSFVMSSQDSYLQKIDLNINLSAYWGVFCNAQVLPASLIRLCSTVLSIVLRAAFTSQGDHTSLNVYVLTLHGVRDITHLMDWLDSTFDEYPYYNAYQLWCVLLSLDAWISSKLVRLRSIYCYYHICCQSIYWRRLNETRME